MSLPDGSQLATTRTGTKKTDETGFSVIWKPADRQLR